jgi:hypothetical protein
MRNDICSFCESTDNVWFSHAYNNYLCHRHWMQFYHTGKLKTRFRNDKNEIVLFDDRAEIFLYDKHGDYKCSAIIDLFDIEKCSLYKWHCQHEGYVMSRIAKSRGYIFLHNFIMNNTSHEYIVDHINHNTLDNRKNNLRICSYSNNNMNSVIRKNNTSGCKGVSYSKRDKNWEAYIAINGVRIRHISFDTFEEAVVARKLWEQEFFGEYNYE